MSQWDQLQMDTKISQILNVHSHDPNHHFGRPFLTPYQIAIGFKKEFKCELHRANLHCLKYEVDDGTIESSLDRAYDLSMFRLIDQI